MFSTDGEALPVRTHFRVRQTGHFGDNARLQCTKHVIGERNDEAIGQEDYFGTMLTTIGVASDGEWRRATAQGEATTKDASP